MNHVHPVILCGGSGTRLWPLSRASYPKQLLALTGQHTLLQDTLLRAAALPGVQPPVLICNEEHRFLVNEQVQALRSAPAALVLEPCGRNTAPAIALAALHLAETSPQALMLVLPADHVVDNQAAFAQAVAAGLPAAQAGSLCTFGIAPTSAETGYGYILAGPALPHAPMAHSVAQFVEKPDAATAAQFLEQGGYTWNSGMFLFLASAYLAELELHRPDILAAARAAWQGRTQDLGFVRPDPAAFSACPAQSIDYAVMQPTQHAAVVPATFGWSDVGSWASLWAIAGKDARGNVCVGDTYVAHTHNSYIRAESRLVAVMGLQDVVVVETPDAVLVMHKDQSQNIKAALDYIQQAGRKEHLEHLRVHRPWGWYEGIDAGERFQVKRIMVSPGATLSLQMHHHRAEHWVVVSGTAKVTVNGTETLLTENQSTYIPLGHTHRLENPGKLPLHLIEVQSGAYLGEDDIVRFEDNYQRAPRTSTPQ